MQEKSETQKSGVLSYVVDTDETGVLHGLGKAVPLLSVQRNTDMVGAVFVPTRNVDFHCIGVLPMCFVVETTQDWCINLYFEVIIDRFC